MPAIITHDLFAKDLYGETFETVGGSRDEAEAFLLGNQGPDPLFFAATDPRYLAFSQVGTTLHRVRPAEVLLAFKQAVAMLPAPLRSTGRAYVLGFACHYELDRAVHPLTFSQERALCHAGVEGLGPEDHSEVHALIETEMDEFVLTAKRNETVASFNPAKAVLKGSDTMLAAVSQLYARAVKTALDMDIPDNLFKASVKAYRRAQHLLYSPAGWKRTALGSLERLVRPHSLLGALSHRAELRPESAFANDEHAPWQHPYLEGESTASFWDLYGQARTGALATLEALDDDDFDLDAAHGLTGDLNFYGEPVAAVIVSVETVTPASARPSDDAVESEA